ncbi:hypothetical protein B9T11_05100 [Wohlfahrtiimonas chitiniclastica]|uniref:hypothetical protein n=1 Tax=Wohlfahrtiimonas chitiniclastica TaxID=400946 RepID=UPI000B99AFA9|nr:hypothetical protein [Wohlfahrtiimonas chitiniclastica]OYQ80861.1 hypothetical protein B9T11_05100 [Wohlfahrtiimonas chitiniclastica]
MSMTKNHWHDEISMPRHSYSRLASILEISQEELNGLSYEIDEHRSRDGMLYNYFITFYGDHDSEILQKIKGLEEGYYVTLEPWDLYGYEEDLELQWQITHSDQFERFSKNIEAGYRLIQTTIDDDVKFNFLVMLHTYIISTFEEFLSSTFSHHVMNSKKLMGRFLEVDDILSKQKFTLKDIYGCDGGIGSLVANHLNNMSFHNIKKVSELFNKVLSFQFTEIEWLIDAVDIRHDCVHRAGYKRDNGEIVDITVDGVKELMVQCEGLAKMIDDHMRN